MTLNGLVVLQGVEGIQALSQRHFVVQTMDARVATLAEIDADVALVARQGLAKMGAPVHLAGNQVVKGQSGQALAKRTVAVFVSCHC